MNQELSIKGKTKMNLNDYLNKLRERKNLTQKQSKELLSLLMEQKTTPEQISQILKNLAVKGETIEEIVGFAEGMRELMLSVDVPADSIDIVGTGGDGSNSFNISTISAIVTAACGVPVAKHGNRAASSKCGSADVLESLEININLTPEKAAKVLDKVGMVFLLAPMFHPAMKVVGPVRKELKIRTIFNYLGPFLNPAKVKRMLLGVTNLEMAEKFLEIAKQLNFEHLIIVTSNDGMDEISVAGKTTAFELKNGEVRKYIIDPQKLGFKKYSKTDLVGGDPEINATIARDILTGRETGAKRDAVILNSAYGLLIGEKSKNIREGMKLSAQAISSGKALQLLDNLVKETNR